MLDFIRRRATGWVAWVIVILISIPFALWGVNEYMAPVSTLAVAEVNDQEIGLREFQEAYQNRRLQLQRLLGPNASASLDDARIRAETIDGLIEDTLVLQAAAESGMRVGDAQLANIIQSQAVFQQDGAFSQQLYENWLASQGLSPGGFEQSMRADLLTNQLIVGLTGSSFAVDAELARLRALQAQRRTFQTLKVPADTEVDLEISDAAVTEHYEANNSSYSRPELVSVEYLEISRDKIAAGIPVDDDELRRVYEARQASFVTPEQRQVSHILLNLPVEADQQTTDQARSKLMDIRAQIQAGATFEELARQHSQDVGTAQNGGALGFVAKGVMDPSFEAAAFALNEGEISEPVRSRFGLHLIKVTEIRAPGTRSFDEIKPQLRAEHRNEQADLVFSEQAERLATLVFEHPESLEIPAETLSIKPKISEPFSRAGAAAGLGAHRGVVAAAFSDDVLTARNNSELIELPDGRVIALRIHDHQPRALLPLAEVRPQIVEELKRRNALQAAKNRGEKLVNQLKQGASLASVADSAGLEWSQPRTVQRFGENADPQIGAVIFRMPRPQPGRPSIRGRTLPDGSFQIIALESVSDGSEVGSPAGEQDELRNSLVAAYGAALVDEYVGALRGSAKIAINHQNLDGSL